MAGFPAGRRPAPDPRRDLVGGVALPLVTALATAALLAPLTEAPAAPAGAVAFPERIASYSWWTPHLAPAQVEAATMLYQNGFGVELGDLPQSVVLGADAATYRRLAAAEDRGIPADQGDPAQSLLSADGTFVVVGGQGRDGSVDVVDLGSLDTRSVAVGAGRSAVPLSIDASGRRVLLLTSGEELSRYADPAFELRGELALLDLTTSRLTPYELPGTVTSAAISPDGALVAVDAEGSLTILDATSGQVLLARDPLAGPLGDDAWSPSGTSIAVVGQERALQVVSVSDDAVGAREVALDGPYSSVIGWRDDEHVLVHSTQDDEDDGSRIDVVDVRPGAEEPVARTVAAYAQDPLTGAALGSVDLARDLAGEWATSGPAGAAPLAPL
uniref:WD40 repeat domain-containing protein n=1 Tax=Clavibacter sp. MX14-G9D TaxID=3064656 RepID=UPI00293EF861